MKLIYWVCRQEHDHECYNIRARTRKEAVRLKSQMEKTSGKHYERYSKPFKVIVEYTDGYDLMSQAMSEGSLYEYPRHK